MKHFAVAAMLSLLAAPAFAATDTWDDLRDSLYGDQPLLDGKNVVAIDAPYRTPDDARAELSAHIAAPKETTIQEVTIILDENPMPVSAVFKFERPQPRFFFNVTMRVNGPTPLHVVARMSDGRLFVSETFVKTTGLGACSAPPGTDPKLALKTLGEMEIELVGRVTNGGVGPLELVSKYNRLDVDIDHPSHSGMQMDQITLLFTPMRYVETVDIDLDGAGFVEITGSISLSENPRVSLSVPQSAQSVDVTMTDTDGTVSTKRKKLAGF